jgi:hypothetical protein
LRSPVSHDDGATVAVAHIAVALYARLDLRFQSLLQHPSRSLTCQAFERGR